MSTRTAENCFVIMPFGEREIDGVTIDFDKIYKDLIKDTIENLNMTCVRSDEIAQTGWIQSEMFKHIYQSRVAVVDITSRNPNVFYELGVRHALVDSVTVLLRRKGTTIPFNIQGFKVIDYDEDYKSFNAAKKQIAEFIKNGLERKRKDSPVHEVLKLRIDTAPKPIRKTTFYEYCFPDVPHKKVGLVTGDIRFVKGIDVWVNSENTNMQMARHYDKSISGTIRYCGAKKGPDNVVVDDIIAKELSNVAGNQVPAGEIIVTGAGELEQGNGVKKIFHAAAVTGQPAQGYTPIADIGVCVRNALCKADADEFRTIQLESILFPLLGTGEAGGDLEQKARELIDTAIAHLEGLHRAVFKRCTF